MKKIANQIRKFLKENNINTTVKVNGEVIIIDNLGYDDAANVASAATGLNFTYMTQSMTKLSKTN